MSGITCQVINSLNNQPVVGLQTLLRCLSHRTTYDPRTFKGRTELDGEVHYWHSSDKFQSYKPEQLLEEIGGNRSVWQVGFDTGRFFGVESTCWPAIEVNFNLIPGKFSEPYQSYHVKLFIKPYGYETGLSLRPFARAASEYRDPSGIQTPSPTLMQAGVEIIPATRGELEVQTALAIPTSLNVQALRVDPERGTSKVTPAKRRAPNQYLSEFQRNVLAAHYAFDQYPNLETVLQLSTYLGVRKKKIQSWFSSQRCRNGISKSKKGDRLQKSMEGTEAADRMERVGDMQRTESIGNMEDIRSMESMESMERAEVMSDRFNSSAEGMKDQPDTFR